ncbi:MAG: hypothetical protein NTY53_09315 [Kiritimatiellaeota bacterium]|nr:hypothetical protein [Kiritimatiellota bacterium]
MLGKIVCAPHVQAPSATKLIEYRHLALLHHGGLTAIEADDEHVLGLARSKCRAVQEQKSEKQRNMAYEVVFHGPEHNRDALAPQEGTSS